METAVLNFINKRNTTENEIPTTTEEILLILEHIKNNSKEKITQNVAKNFIEHIKEFGI